jgi:hypothetical protein
MAKTDTSTKALQAGAADTGDLEILTPIINASVIQ